MPDAEALVVHGGGQARLVADGRGHYALEVAGDAPVAFSLPVGSGERPTPPLPDHAPVIETGELSDATEDFLSEVAAMRGSSLDRARRVKQHVRGMLEYSNDSSYNARYRNGDPVGYFQRIEEGGKADCDVANTYGAALLARLRIPFEVVVGHYTRHKDATGAAVLSSGTAHAWLRVWDGTAWCRLDMTPPGDPTMDDEETDEQQDDAMMDGDFGEQDAPEVSDEEMEEMLRKAERDLREREQSPHERAALAFAMEAGCSPDEARRIQREMDVARELRDPQGRNIRSRMVGELLKIAHENTVAVSAYKAPVRLSDADELDDPVEATIGLRSGDPDPTGGAKREKKVEREQTYGGMDVILVADRSGSMGDADPVTGVPKCEDQRRFLFLTMDAMHTGADEFRRRRVRLLSPLDVRAGLVVFRAGGAQVVAPLSDRWGPKEQYAVWKALSENVGGGTPDHLGLDAVATMLLEDAAGRPANAKDRVQLVAVSADGGSDNAAATRQAKEQLQATGVVVKAAGIGAGARQIVVPYGEDGKNLDSFADVPAWLGEHVVTEAQRLRPKKKVRR